MHRFIESARFQMQHWLSLTSRRSGVPSELANGLDAYAKHQAYIHVRQAMIASQMWGLSSSMSFWDSDPAAQLLSPWDGTTPGTVEVDFDVEDESLDIVGEADALNLSDVE
jgi:hypothetical protein